MDIVKLKKQHPCGSNEWEILRVGADFRLKCMGCGHHIMLARKLVEKNTRDLKKILDYSKKHGRIILVIYDYPCSQKRVEGKKTKRR